MGDPGSGASAPGANPAELGADADRYSALVLKDFVTKSQADQTAGQAAAAKSLVATYLEQREKQRAVGDTQCRQGQGADQPEGGEQPGQATVVLVPGGQRQPVHEIAEHD